MRLKAREGRGTASRGHSAPAMEAAEPGTKSERHQADAMAADTPATISCAEKQPGAPAPVSSAPVPAPAATAEPPHVAQVPLPDVRPSTPGFDAAAAEDCQLFESARACVEQHLAASTAAFGGGQYPPATATHDEVVASPELFHATLDSLHAALGTKISKMMRLGGQELNLHLLYQRV